MSLSNKKTLLLPSSKKIGTIGPTKIKRQCTRTKTTAMERKAKIKEKECCGGLKVREITLVAQLLNGIDEKISSWPENVRSSSSHWTRQLSSIEKRHQRGPEKVKETVPWGLAHGGPGYFWDHYRGRRRATSGLCGRDECVGSFLFCRYTSLFISLHRWDDCTVCCIIWQFQLSRAMQVLRAVHGVNEYWRESIYDWGKQIILDNNCAAPCILWHVQSQFSNSEIMYLI